MTIERATEQAEKKGDALSGLLASLGSVIVAYSGGVDSAYLAYAASRVLGDRSVAVTADSPSYPDRHRRLAIDIATAFSLRHEIIQTHEIDLQEYRANPANRCYFCKHELYTHLARIAAERQAIVIDGNNADDRGDYRPGRQAAREFGVRSPLDEVDLREGRDPRTVPPRGPADVGRAGLSVSVVAHSVPLRSDGRQAADDRTGGRCRSRARVPGLPRPASRRDGPRGGRPRRDAARARSGRQRRDGARP